MSKSHHFCTREIFNQHSRRWRKLCISCNWTFAGFFTDISSAFMYQTANEGEYYKFTYFSGLCDAQSWTLPNQAKSFVRTLAHCIPSFPLKILSSMFSDLPFANSLDPFGNFHDADDKKGFSCLIRRSPLKIWVVVVLVASTYKF